MKLRLLRYFLIVAKEQSFTKAAEQLHITQPTLSRQMAAFEEELGVSLFIRKEKKISLTDEGILLKRRALEILNLGERTIEELKERYGLSEIRRDNKGCKLATESDPESGCFFVLAPLNNCGCQNTRLVI